MNSYYEKIVATGDVKCIDEEIPFDIPKGWEWVRMGVIGDWGAGATPAKGNAAYYGGNILWLRTGELNDGIVYDTEIKVTQKALAECSLRINKIGDVLIAMYGATIGKVAIAGKELTTNQACCACTPFGIYNWFLFYFLMGSKEDFVKKGEGGAQPNISREKLIHHLMPLPPLAEQRRIVEKTRDVLLYIKQYENLQKSLNALNGNIRTLLKKSILQEAIQGRLVPQIAEEGTAQDLLERIKQEKLKLIKGGKLKKSVLTNSVIFKGDDNKYYEQVGDVINDISEEIAFDIPENWRWCRLKDLCRIITGATFKKEESSQNEKGIRVLRGGNILPFRIICKSDDLFLDKSRVKPEIILRKNDLITPAVTSLENICKMARISEDMESTTVGGFVFILRPYSSNSIFSIYLLEALCSPTLVEHIKSITNKSGQAFYNIGKERLATVLIPLPPIAEQQKINTIIEELFQKLT